MSKEPEPLGELGLAFLEAFLRGEDAPLDSWVYRENWLVLLSAVGGRRRAHHGRGAAGAAARGPGGLGAGVAAEGDHLRSVPLERVPGLQDLVSGGAEGQLVERGGRRNPGASEGGGGRPSCEADYPPHEAMGAARAPHQGPRRLALRPVRQGWPL